MMDYKEADSQLQGRNYNSRKLANNTYLLRDGESITVKLHNTPVITFHQTGDITLNSGGWQTYTTKERINANIPRPWGLYQAKGNWFVHNRDTGQEYKFSDGMTIHPDGSVTGAGEHNPAKDRAIKKQVREYAKLYRDNLPLEEPGQGDCWFCVMVTDEGKTLGDTWQDTDHLIGHMEEGYIVPALALHALEERYNAPMAFYDVFAPEGEHHGTPGREFGKQAIERAVYRYVLSRLGYSV